MQRGRCSGGSCKWKRQLVKSFCAHGQQYQPTLSVSYPTKKLTTRHRPGTNLANSWQISTDIGQLLPKCHRYHICVKKARKHWSYASSKHLATFDHEWLAQICHISNFPFLWWSSSWSFENYDCIYHGYPANYHQSHSHHVGICHNDEWWEYDTVKFPPYT